MTTENDSENATIEVGGIRVTAHRDLVRMAGWHVHGDGTTRLEGGEYAARRLIRATCELQIGHLTDLQGAFARNVLTRVVTLGEIEGAEARRDNTRREVAQAELRAAGLRLQTAEMEMAAASRRK